MTRYRITHIGDKWIVTVHHNGLRAWRHVADSEALAVAWKRRTEGTAWGMVMLEKGLVG